MDKLEPVLKQKFWILLGIAIIMTFTGWWMATGQMAAAITARTGEIDKSFSSVPTGEIPNESWAKRLSVVNAEQDQSIKATQLAMWKRQQAKMHWPAEIEPVNGYWGKFPTHMRQLFRDAYIDEVTQTWKMMNPMDDAAGTGIIKYQLPTLFNKVLRRGPWNSSPPDSDTMWETQEDLWLLEGLFQSIAALNGGPEATRADAIIHQIDRLELRGGGEKKSAGSAAGAASDSGSFGSAMGMSAAPGLGTSSGGMSAMSMAGGPAAALAAVSAEFDPAEEFGEDGSAPSGSGGGGGGSLSMSSAMAVAMGSGDSSASSGASAKTVTRYISNEPGKPFKTRGFYLSVKMDHTKIPLLIEALTSNEESVWPVEIVRVQMSRLNEDDASFGGGAGGRSPRNYPGMSSMSGGPSTASMSSMSALGGLGGPTQEEDLFAAFTGAAPRQAVGSDVPTSPQGMAARVALENMLKDPIMAQVTICGIFTLYNKVDEPAEPAPPAATAPQNPDEAVAPEAKSTEEGDKAPATAEAPAAEPAINAAEQTNPAEAPADKTDTPSQKPEEPKPEPKPEPNEK
jgi:hypothetical protein